MVEQQSYRGVVQTASDTVNIADAGVAKVALGFMLFTTAGDVAVITDNAETVTFKSVPLNTVIPIRCTRIKATGTAGTGLLALFPVAQP